MEKTLILSMVFLCLFSACSGAGSGVEYNKDGHIINTFVTSSQENNCRDLKSVCESKELLPLPGYVGDNVEKIQLFPKKVITCKYRCVNQETYDKMIVDKKYWAIECAPSKEDFSFNNIIAYTRVSAPDLHLFISHPLEKNISFLSIETEGDFSGVIGLNEKSSEGRKTETDVFFHFEGIEYPSPSNTLDASIVFNYALDGINKSFKSDCTLVN